MSIAGGWAWRRRYRPGLCYYRLGPDFVFVKDVRTSGDSARFRLDGVVDAFRALEAVVDVTSLDSSTVALLEDLDREGLVRCCRVGCDAGRSPPSRSEPGPPTTHFS